MQVCSHQHKKDRKAQVKLFIFFTRKYLQLQDVVKKKKKKKQKTTTKENIKKRKQTSKQNAHTHTHKQHQTLKQMWYSYSIPDRANAQLTPMQIIFLIFQTWHKKLIKKI